MDADARRYWRENRHRIVTALIEAKHVLVETSTRSGSVRILDVGPSMETILLAEMFPQAELETMGWSDHRYQTPVIRRNHALDLNLTETLASCPIAGPYDLVLCLEVIEHLHVAPVHLLRYLHACLSVGGALILSTPNAAFLRNRWRLLRGRNPFEPLRESSINPGHFRESTEEEMRAALVNAGFAVEKSRLANLYEFGSRSGRWACALSNYLPSSFRHDMLFVARRRH